MFEHYTTTQIQQRVAWKVLRNKSSVTTVAGIVKRKGT
jgi:hypothetical protein